MVALRSKLSDFVLAYPIFFFHPSHRPPPCPSFSFVHCLYLSCLLPRYFLYCSSNFPRLALPFMVQPFRIGDISGYQVAVVTNNGLIRTIAEGARLMRMCLLTVGPIKAIRLYKISTILEDLSIPVGGPPAKSIGAPLK